MTHEVAPAVLVIHEVAAECEAIQGGNAAMNFSCATIRDRASRRLIERKVVYILCYLLVLFAVVLQFEGRTKLPTTLKQDFLL